MTILFPCDSAIGMCFVIYVVGMLLFIERPHEASLDLFSLLNLFGEVDVQEERCGEGVFEGAVRFCGKSCDCFSGGVSSAHGPPPAAGRLPPPELPEAAAPCAVATPGTRPRPVLVHCPPSRPWNRCSRESSEGQAPGIQNCQA